MYFDEQRQRQVLVGILHTEMVPIAWAFGLRNLQFSGAILPVAGRPYDAARNAICEQALAGGFEWVFMLDSDVIPPHDAVARLLSHNQPIVSGVYARRSPPHGLPVMQRTEGWGRSWVSSLPPRGLIEVEVVGAGCLLIHRSVLEKLPPIAPGKHWFHWGIELAGEAAQGRIDPGYCQSEDFSFNHHCRKHGYRVLVDCSVRCRHVGLAEADVGSFKPCESTPLT